MTASRRWRRFRWRCRGTTWKTNDVMLVIENTCTYRDSLEGTTILLWLFNHRKLGKRGRKEGTIHLLYYAVGSHQDQGVESPGKVTSANVSKKIDDYCVQKLRSWEVNVPSCTMCSSVASSTRQHVLVYRCCNCTVLGKILTQQCTAIYTHCETRY